MEAVATLPERRTALAAYCRRLEAFDAEMWDKVLDIDGVLEVTAVSGTYGILGRDSVKFFALMSVSRGIPRREWDVIQGPRSPIFHVLPSSWHTRHR